MQKTSSRRPLTVRPAAVSLEFAWNGPCKPTDYRKQAVCQAAFCHDAAKGRRVEATRGDQRSSADAPSPEGTQLLGKCIAKVPVAVTATSSQNGARTRSFKTGVVSQRMYQPPLS